MTDSHHAGTINQPTTILNSDRLRMHHDTRIDSYCLINAAGRMIMHPESCIHAGSHVVGTDRFVMGTRSVVTYNAVLLTSSADLAYPASSVVPEEERESVRGGVELGAESFVGACAVVAPGVTVGPGAVVAAGSYVDRDVPQGTIHFASGHRDKRPAGPWQEHITG